MGKLLRLDDVLRSDPSINARRPYPFLILDGVISDFVPWVRSGGHGTVTGVSNFAPAATMRLWDLLNKAATLSSDEAAELQHIQLVLSRADAFAMAAGVRGLSMSPAGRS